MKNTIFFDSNFNFTLLENEENPENSIYIKFHTSDAANQVLNILANASTITESLASDTDIVYELEQTNWTNNGATVIWLSNDNISSPKVKIIFSEIPTASCAINRGTNTVFLMQYEGQAEEESGGGSGGGSGSGGSGSDFVEIIRNIGFRLLDEPSNVTIEYDDEGYFIKIIDIATNGSLGIVKISVPRIKDSITLKYKKETDLNWTSVLITDDMLYTTVSGSPLFYTFVVDNLIQNTNYEFQIVNGSYTSAITTAYTSVKTSVFNYNYQKTKVVYGQGCTVTSNDSDQTFTLLSIAGYTDCYTGTYQDFDVPSSQFITLTPDNLTYTKLVFYSIGHLLQGSGNTKARNMLFKGSSSEDHYDDGIQSTIAFNSKTEVYDPVILSIEGYTANDIFTMRYGMLVEEGETASVKYDDIMIWFE